MLLIIATAVLSLVVGGGLGWAIYKLNVARTLRLAREEAQDLVDEAKEAVELRNLEEKERIQEIEMELWTRVEAMMLKQEERI